MVAVLDAQPKHVSASASEFRRGQISITRYSEPLFTPFRYLLGTLVPGTALSYVSDLIEESQPPNFLTHTKRYLTSEGIRR